MKGKTRVVGAMAVGYANSHRFSARERDMLNAITAQVAMTVERSWLLDQLQEQLARENSLREVATRIGSTLELDVVLDAIVSQASRLLAAEFSSIFLAEDPAGQSPQVEVVGGERGRIHGSAVQLGDSPLGNAVHQAMETARPALAQTPASHPPAGPLVEPKPNDYRVALVVPLLSDRDVLGALVTCYLEKRHFDASDISLAEAFATQAALAIRNAWVYEEAMESRLSLESALNQINNHGISLMDDDLNILFANPAAFWLLGVAPKRREMSRDEWTALLKRGLADGEELDRAIEQILANPEDTVSADLRARIPADSPRSVRLLSLPLRQPDGTLRGRVNLIEETSN
jgi:adenylate cyclase